jgi:predicted N-acetyltransferase YhbS
MPQPVKGLPAGAVVRPISGVPQGAIVRPIGGGAVDDTPEAPQQSGLSKAWQVANKPIADFALGDGASSDFLTSAATGMNRNDLRSASQEINTNTHDWAGGTSPEDETFMQRLNPVRQYKHLKASLFDPDSPEAQSFRTGTLGALADTADTAASFTSPLSIATYGLGSVAQGGRALNSTGKVGRLAQASAEMNTAARVAPRVVAASAPAARVLGGVAGAGFAANAADNFFDDKPDESKADALGRKLNAAGMFFGGAAGAAHSVKGEMPGPSSSMGDRANEGGGTRGDVYKYARDNGIDMNLAQAGEGKFARTVETTAENTLGGSGRMAKMKDQQQAQVDQHINNIKDKLDPHGKGKDTVQQGELVQRAADVAADVSRTNASTKYDELDNMATPTIKSGVSLMRDELVDRRPIKQQAQSLYNQLNKGNVNSVKPTEAMSVLKSIIDGPDYSSFGDAHADRSNLNNAHFTDAVSKGKGERALSILSKAFKDQMAVSAQSAEASGMKGAVKKYNEAQKAWSDHMAVFGDNSSPIVKAIQQKEPGKILDTFLNNSSGGSVRAMRQMSEVAPAFKGLLKRELVNRLTANDPTYKTFNSRLSKYGEPFLKELFKPEELDALRKTGQVTKSLNLDVNPSGSGKYGVSAAASVAPLFEIGRGVMHLDPAAVATGVGGLGAMAGGSNVAARVLGHQGLTDKLMGYEPTTAAPAINKPGFTATAAQAPQQQPQGKTIANPFGQPTGKGLSNPARRRAGNNPQAGFATPAAMLDLASGGVSLIAKKIRDVISKPENVAGKMAKSLEENGGFTYNLAKGDQFGKDAFAVSAFPERAEVYDKQPGKKVIAQYIDKNKDILGSEHGDRVHVGGWKGSDGKWYLDLSTTTPDLASARKLAATADQKAIFDLKHGKEIDTGGTGAPRENSVPADQLLARLKDVPKDAEYLDAVHYTNNADLKELDPAFAGKGPFAGAERSRADKVPSTYLGERDVYKEPRVQRGASARYAADINRGRLYDMKSDPEGLMKSVGDGSMTFSDAEKKAQSFGYSGLRDPEQGLITSWDKVGDIRREMPEPKGSSVELIKNPRKLDNGATISDMAKVLEQHTKANLKPLKVGDAPDPEVVSRAADLAEAEIKYQLASESNHGQDWYKGDVKKMEDAVAQLHPEIGKDADKTSMFKAITTAMSLGNDGDATIKQALEAYDRYKKDGSVPLERSPGEPWGGQYPGNNRAALENIQKLVTKFGEKGAVKWLSETHPVAEIEKVKANKSPLTVPMGMREVPGSFIMGPKAGPFYQNLNGDFSHLTADVWFNRSWNRWMGTMFDKNGETQSVARSPRERRLQVEAFKTVADRLKMSVAEAQAVMWYYEQRLYTQHGLDSHSGSYGDAAERITKQLSGPDTKESAKAAAAGANAQAGSVSDSGGSGAAEVRDADHEGEGDTSFDFSPRTGRTSDRTVSEASEDDVNSLRDWEKSAGERGSRSYEAARIAKNLADVTKLGDSDAMYVVKDDDGKVVGVTTLDMYSSPGKGQKSPITIDYLAVHPEAQGMGVGKRLIQHTIDLAAEEGRGVNLLSKSGSRTFYEALGFKLSPQMGESRYEMSPEEVKARATPKEEPSPEAIRSLERTKSPDYKYSDADFNIKGLHGSQTPIKEFGDPTEDGQHMVGDAIYFSKGKWISSYWANGSKGHVYSADLAMKKPFIISDDQVISRSDADKLIDMSVKAGTASKQWYRIPKSEVSKKIEDVKSDIPRWQSGGELKTSELWQAMYHVSPVFISDALKKLGYDGVIHHAVSKNGDVAFPGDKPKDTVYAVFSKNQIKNVQKSK